MNKGSGRYKDLIWIAMLALSSSAWAVEGDGKGNGGSPKLLRIKLVTEFINTELRDHATAYLRELDLGQVRDSSARSALEDMIARDIATDIRVSKYVIQDSCASIGGQEAGGALQDDRGGDICLSPKALVELDSSKAEIVGLVIHEHSHHFGYADADYAIYKAVYQSVRLANPAWGSPQSGGAPLPEGMSFVKLGPGSFWMGSAKLNPHNPLHNARHLVHLTRPFEIQTTPVTQAQYIQVMAHNPSKFQKPEDCPESFTHVLTVPACPDHPVQNVSWDAAQRFIARLNAIQQDPRYVYRLPTEAEWEYAARGGTDTDYSFGDDPSMLDQYGWFAGNSGDRTHPVASLKPNPYGLYDVHGNIWQWVEDFYGLLPDHPVSDPIQNDASKVRHVFRGGSWSSSAADVQSAFRWGASPWNDANGVGFRLARSR